MENLNFTAIAKLNEVYRVYGEKVMTTYESYLDACLSGGSTVVEFTALQDMMPTCEAVSEITAYAENHAAQIIAENKKWDDNFAICKTKYEAELQAKNTKVIGGPRTSRMMMAAAESIGMTYSVERKDRKKIHTIGKCRETSTTKLYAKIETEVNRAGDRAVLGNAKYSSGFNCFEIVLKDTI